MSIRPPKGIILDVDGTLVDSNDAHARAWYDVLAEAGYSVSVERLRRLIGMGGDRLLPAAAGIEKDSPEGKRLSEQRNMVFKERYLPELKPTRGARELLERLRADNFKLAVASSAEQDELRALLDIAGAVDLMQETTTSSEVEESKPDPDVVQVALKKLGLPAEEAVMLGDTPYDVEAANGARVRIIGVRSGGWSDDELRGAAAVYQDPADLLAHYADSLLCEDSSRATR